MDVFLVSILAALSFGYGIWWERARAADRQYEAKVRERLDGLR